MTDRITQLPAPPEARDDPAHTIEALNDQLQDQAIELDMLREALGVPYEPHQSLLERMLEAARGRAGSGAAPEPPAQEPTRDLLAEATEQVEALERENHRMRRCVARLMARLTVWLDDDQFNEADGIMTPEFEPPAQQPMSRDREVWRAALTLANNICVQESDRYNGDDASQEASAAGYCARRICDWIAPTDEQLAEMFEEAGIGKGDSNA